VNWTVAGARRRFAELLAEAKRAPQPIYRRKELVGVVVGPDQLAKLGREKRALPRPSLGEALADLRAICGESGYAFRTPARRNRRAARFSR
jgi:hypothetical protein